MVARESNIENMVKYLDKNADELHLSTDLYDINGQYIGCNFIMDIDCKGNIRKALEDTRTVSSKLLSLGIKHDVFYSGNKGFHIDTCTPIFGALAQRTCAAIVSKHFNLPTVDRQIYRRNGTIRAVGSINLSSGRRKVLVDVNESLDDMIDRSRKSCPIVVAQKFYDNDQCNLLDGVSVPIERDFISNGQTVFKPVKPCVRSMMDSSIPDGSRNTAAYIIVHSLLSAGAEPIEVEAYFNNSEFWSEQGISWMSTLRTAIRNGVKSVSCKHGFASDVMISHCQEICWEKDCDISCVFKSWRNSGTDSICF